MTFKDPGVITGIGTDNTAVASPAKNESRELGYVLSEQITGDLAPELSTQSLKDIHNHFDHLKNNLCRDGAAGDRPPAESNIREFIDRYSNVVTPPLQSLPGSITRILYSRVFPASSSPVGVPVVTGRTASVTATPAASESEAAPDIPVEGGGTTEPDPGEIPETTTDPQDLNGDGLVDDADLLIWINHLLGVDSSLLAELDSNHNGRVDLEDLIAAGFDTEEFLRIISMMVRHGAWELAVELMDQLISQTGLTAAGNTFMLRDINKDGVVDYNDLLRFAAAFGNGEYDADCDFNRDGIIDWQDIALGGFTPEQLDFLLQAIAQQQAYGLALELLSMLGLGLDISLITGLIVNYDEATGNLLITFQAGDGSGREFQIILYSSGEVSVRWRGATSTWIPAVLEGPVSGELAEQLRSFFRANERYFSNDYSGQWHDNAVFDFDRPAIEQAISADFLPNITPYDIYLYFADINGDGKVDEEDLRLVREARGKRQGDLGWTQIMDINSDGVVDEADECILMSVLGNDAIGEYSRIAFGEAFTYNRDLVYQSSGLTLERAQELIGTLGLMDLNGDWLVDEKDLDIWRMAMGGDLVLAGGVRNPATGMIEDPVTHASHCAYDPHEIRDYNNNGDIDNRDRLLFERMDLNDDGMVTIDDLRLAGFNQYEIDYIQGNYADYGTMVRQWETDTIDEICRRIADNLGRLGGYTLERHTTADGKVYYLNTATGEKVLISAYKGVIKVVTFAAGVDPFYCDPSNHTSATARADLYYADGRIQHGQYTYWLDGGFGYQGTSFTMTSQDTYNIADIGITATDWDLVQQITGRRPVSHRYDDSIYRNYFRRQMHNASIMLYSRTVNDICAYACDFNGNGEVDTEDLETILRARSDPTLFSEHLDINGNGTIDDQDVAFVRTFLGKAYDRDSMFYYNHTMSWEQNMLDLVGVLQHSLWQWVGQLGTGGLNADEVTLLINELRTRFSGNFLAEKMIETLENGGDISQLILFIHDPSVFHDMVNAVEEQYLSDMALAWFWHNATAPEGLVFPDSIINMFIEQFGSAPAVPPPGTTFANWWASFERFQDIFKVVVKTDETTGERRFYLAYADGTLVDFDQTGDNRFHNPTDGKDYDNKQYYFITLQMGSGTSPSITCSGLCTESIAYALNVSDCSEGDGTVDYYVTSSTTYSRGSSFDLYGSLTASGADLSGYPPLYAYGQLAIYYVLRQAGIQLDCNGDGISDIGYDQWVDICNTLNSGTMQDWVNDMMDRGIFQIAKRDGYWYVHFEGWTEAYEGGIDALYLLMLIAMVIEARERVVNYLMQGFGAQPTEQGGKSLSECFGEMAQHFTEGAMRMASKLMTFIAQANQAIYNQKLEEAEAEYKRQAAEAEENTPWWCDIPIFGAALESWFYHKPDEVNHQFLKNKEAIEAQHYAAEQRMTRCYATLIALAIDRQSGEGSEQAKAILEDLDFDKLKQDAKNGFEDLNKQLVYNMTKALESIQNYQKLQLQVQEARLKMVQNLVSCMSGVKISTPTQMLSALMELEFSFANFVFTSAISQISAQITAKQSWVQAQKDLQKFEEYLKAKKIFNLNLLLSSFVFGFVVEFFAATCGWDRYFALKYADKAVPDDFTPSKLSIPTLSETEIQELEAKAAAGDLGAKMALLQNQMNILLKDLLNDGLKKMNGEYQALDGNQIVRILDRMNGLNNQMFIMNMAVEAFLSITDMVTQGLTGVSSRPGGKSISGSYLKSFQKLVSLCSEFNIDTMSKEVENYNRQEEQAKQIQDAFWAAMMSSIFLAIAIVVTVLTFGLDLGVVGTILASVGSVFSISGAISGGKRFGEALSAEDYDDFDEDAAEDMVWEEFGDIDDQEQEARADEAWARYSQIEKRLKRWLNSVSFNGFTLDMGNGYIGADPAAMAQAQKEMMQLYVEELLILMVERAKQNVQNMVIGGLSGFYVPASLSNGKELVDSRYQTIGRMFSAKVDYLNNLVQFHNQALQLSRFADQGILSGVIQIITMCLPLAGESGLGWISQNAASITQGALSLANSLYNFYNVSAEAFSSDEMTARLEEAMAIMDSVWEKSNDPVLRGFYDQISTDLGSMNLDLVESTAHGGLAINSKYFAMLQERFDSIFSKMEIIVSFSQYQNSAYRILLRGLGAPADIDASLPASVVSALRENAMSCLAASFTGLQAYVDRWNQRVEAQKMILSALMSVVMSTVNFVCTCAETPNIQERMENFVADKLGKIAGFLDHTKFGDILTKIMVEAVLNQGTMDWLSNEFFEAFFEVDGLQARGIDTSRYEGTLLGANLDLLAAETRKLNEQIGDDRVQVMVREAKHQLIMMLQRIRQTIIEAEIQATIEGIKTEVNPGVKVKLNNPDKFRNSGYTSYEELAKEEPELCAWLENILLLPPHKSARLISSTDLDVFNAVVNPDGDPTNSALVIVANHLHPTMRKIPAHQAIGGPIAEKAADVIEALNARKNDPYVGYMGKIVKGNDIDGLIKGHFTILDKSRLTERMQRTTLALMLDDDLARQLTSLGIEEEYRLMAIDGGLTETEKTAQANQIRKDFASRRETAIEQSLDRHQSLTFEQMANKMAAIYGVSDINDPVQMAEAFQQAFNRNLDSWEGLKSVINSIPGLSDDIKALWDIPRPISLLSSTADNMIDEWMNPFDLKSSLSGQGQMDCEDICLTFLAFMHTINPQADMIAVVDPNGKHMRIGLRDSKDQNQTVLIDIAPTTSGPLHPTTILDCPLESLANHDAEALDKAMAKKYTRQDDGFVGESYCPSFTFGFINGKTFKPKLSGVVSINTRGQLEETARIVQQWPTNKSNGNQADQPLPESIQQFLSKTGFVEVKQNGHDLTMHFGDRTFHLDFDRQQVAIEMDSPEETASRTVSNQNEVDQFIELLKETRKKVSAESRAEIDKMIEELKDNVNNDLETAEIVSRTAPPAIGAQPDQPISQPANQATEMISRTSSQSSAARIAAADEALDISELTTEWEEAEGQALKDPLSQAALRLLRAIKNTVESSRRANEAVDSQEQRSFQEKTTNNISAVQGALDKLVGLIPPKESKKLAGELAALRNSISAAGGENSLETVTNLYKLVKDLQDIAARAKLPLTTVKILKAALEGSEELLDNLRAEATVEQIMEHLSGGATAENLAQELIDLLPKTLSRSVKIIKALEAKMEQLLTDPASNAVKLQVLTRALTLASTSGSLVELKIKIEEALDKLAQRTAEKLGNHNAKDIAGWLAGFDSHFRQSVADRLPQQLAGQVRSYDRDNDLVLRIDRLTAESDQAENASPDKERETPDISSLDAREIMAGRLTLKIDQIEINNTQAVAYRSDAQSGSVATKQPEMTSYQKTISTSVSNTANGQNTYQARSVIKEIANNHYRNLEKSSTV